MNIGKAGRSLPFIFGIHIWMGPYTQSQGTYEHRNAFELQQFQANLVEGCNTDTSTMVAEILVNIEPIRTIATWYMQDYAPLGV
jgi:hypothetical protein